MNRSLREILGETYIAAVAIAVLLFWSIELVLWALWGPCYRAAEFVFTMPDWLLVFRTVSYLYGALISLAAAWVLSRWIYGAGPLRALMQCRARLARRNDA